MAESPHSHDRTSLASSELEDISSHSRAQTKKRRSCVWDYFEYNEAENKSLCIVIKDDSICGKQITGKFPTNLRNHLRHTHHEAYKNMIEKEEIEKKAREEKERELKSASLKRAHQQTLKESLASGMKYHTSSPKYTEITRKLAIFMGSSTAAYNIAENLEFRDLLKSLDPRYSVPSRQVIVKEVEKVVIELKAKIGSYLEEASKVSITADLWSKKGLTSSYLGITAHFFSRKDNRKHSATLAVRRMTSAHTGLHIREAVDSVLSEWDIHPSKIIASITDNGSNIIAAFRMDRQTEDEHDESSEVEDDYNKYCEADRIDYDTLELDHAMSFSTLNRVSCFAHTLQLVVSKFSEGTTFGEVLGRAHSLVRKVNCSGKATEKLVSLCGKKLTRDTPTRWSSTYLMIDRMLEVRTSLHSVLENLEWDNLAVSEWKQLELIRSLLEPFATFTTLVQGEETTTASCVIPTIMDLTLHLEEFKSQPQTATVADILLKELKHRFRQYTDPSDLNYNPLFVIATALDPRYRLILTAAEVVSAKQEICKMLKERAKEKNGCSTSSASESEAQPITVEGEGDDGPPTKRFRHLNRILEARFKEGLKKRSTLPSEEIEINHYFQSIEPISEKVDPLVFWLEQQQSYPKITPLALDVLCIPASSAAVERVFSTAGISTKGQRNRLSDKNLENEVLLTKNRHFL